MNKKSKICIVSSANIKHMTLITLYTNYLEEKNIDYDLIYFDKYGIDESLPAKNIYKFEKKINRDWNKLKKAKIYFEFGYYAKEILEQNNYELLIIWNTLTSLLIYSHLKKTNSKYILNIRDYFFETNKIIFNMHRNLIHKSEFTTISSEGFIEFLPDWDYMYVNSFNKKMFKTQLYSKKENLNGSIRIGFIGNVRFFDEQMKLIDLLANDPRFELWYCGINSDKIRHYAKKHQISNVVCIGEFPPSDTLEILSNFDIINNLFGNEDIAVKTLTPIRLYYGTEYNIPLIANVGTFLAGLLDEYGLGLPLNLDNNHLAEEIYDWYTSINCNEFKYNCELFNDRTHKQNSIFYSKLDHVFFDFIN